MGCAEDFNVQGHRGLLARTWTRLSDALGKWTQVMVKHGFGSKYCLASGYSSMLAGKLT